LIAAGNSKDLSLRDQVVEKLDDPSPLVRAMAVWALGELLGPDQLKSLHKFWSVKETDLVVAQEWSRLFSNESALLS
jgi:epoxyqueuosine reductase